MKYFITINQLILAKTGLDIIDAGILDYIYYFCTTPNEKVIECRVCEKDFCWTWIDFNKLLEDMPLLKITDKGPLSRRIDKIKAVGYVQTKKIGSQKLYFRIMPKYDELLKSNESVALKQQGRCPKATEIDILNRNIKDNIPCGDVDKHVDKREEHLKLSDQMKSEYDKTFGNLLKHKQPPFSLIMKLAYEQGKDEVIRRLGNLREAKNFYQIRDFAPYLVTMCKPKNQ